MSKNYHRRVVDSLRALDPVDNKAVRSWVDSKSDDEVIRLMFRNVRIDEDEVRGGKLSSTGAKLLKSLFAFWEVKLDHPMTSRQQLRFARACRLPYYYTNQTLLCFEKEVGVWLALIQGNNDLMDDVLPE